jgi:hypothetical protein
MNVFAGRINNVAVGNYAGSFQKNYNALTNPENSIYIGSKARGLNNDDNNSIVIGHEAVSEGPHTTVIGTPSTQSTRLFGQTITRSLSVEQNTSTTTLTVSGTTTLNGRVTLSTRQGDISMGIYGGN